MGTKKSGETKKLSYEQSREKLTDIVAELERGDLSLEQALVLWEEGQVLAVECEKWLEGVKQRIDETVKKFDSGQTD